MLGNVNVIRIFSHRRSALSAEDDIKQSSLQSVRRTTSDWINKSSRVTHYQTVSSPYTVSSVQVSQAGARISYSSKYNLSSLQYPLQVSKSPNRDDLLSSLYDTRYFLQPRYSILPQAFKSSVPKFSLEFSLKFSVSISSRRPKFLFALSQVSWVLDSGETNGTTTRAKINPNGNPNVVDLQLS